MVFESGILGTKIGIKELRKVGKYFIIVIYNMQILFHTQFNRIFYLLSRSNFTEDARE